MNEKKILKEFKDLNSLDFRINKYYKSSYFYNAKFSVYFDYDFAKKIVLNLNNFLIKKFGKQLVIYNTEIDIESLKTQTLKDYVESRIDQYFDIDQYLLTKNKNI